MEIGYGGLCQARLTSPLLEYNPIRLHPWLTPSVVEQEMAVQAFEEARLWEQEDLPPDEEALLRRNLWDLYT